MESKHVVEVVKWKAKPTVSNDEMVSAVNGILSDLETLPGFISQTLYIDDEGYWVGLYHWETHEQGVASNDLMAARPSFLALTELIDPTSVSIEFLSLPESA